MVYSRRDSNVCLTDAQKVDGIVGWKRCARRPASPFTANVMPLLARSWKSVAY